jgi:hypothetical protein
MPKSTVVCNSILALMYNATPWANVADNAAAAPLANVYVSLHTGTLTPATGTQADAETVYTNYIRVAKARTSSGWEVPASGSTKNEGQIQFAQCGATGATITYVATGTIATGGAGIAWHYGELNSPLSVTEGITPLFADAALTITES